MNFKHSWIYSVHIEPNRIKPTHSNSVLLFVILLAIAQTPEINEMCFEACYTEPQSVSNILFKKKGAILTCGGIRHLFYSQKLLHFQNIAFRVDKEIPNGNQLSFFFSFFFSKEQVLIFLRTVCTFTRFTSLLNIHNVHLRQCKDAF